MSDTMKDLIGTWNVSFKQYRWTYTLATGGVVTWRDVFNGKSGLGRWTIKGTKVEFVWQNSKTKEYWNITNDPDTRTGYITASYATGESTATKDKTRFDAFAPEGQTDNFACWAACFAWYTKVMPDVNTMDQLSIIARSSSTIWARDGAITMNGLLTVNLPTTMLRRTRIHAGELMRYIRAKPFPLIIAFATGPMGGHVNVIHRFDEKTNTVMVMEPWFPNPAILPNYRLEENVYANKTTGMKFNFTGQHISRPVSYYTSKPLNGEFLVCFNTKYEPIP